MQGAAHKTCSKRDLLGMRALEGEIREEGWEGRMRGEKSR